MQRLADTVLGNAKESIKTFTQESFQNTVRFINGFSALVLALLPGKGTSLQGFELHSTFRAPRMPRWMEEGVSSFNSFISEYDTDTESGSDSEYESGIEDSDSTAPPSPSSESSHLSRAGSSGRHHRRNKTLWQRLRPWLIWPLRAWRSGTRESRRLQDIPESRRSSSGSLRGLARRFSWSKEFAVPKHIADRRRGIIEDLQLLIELLIERIFEVVRNGVHHVLSPLKSLREIIHWSFFRDTTNHDEDTEIFSTAILGDADPVPQKQKQAPQQPLNTDSRTCEDIITSLGYPYEAFRVTTEDGHILLLERIPRPHSRKVVLLQHGVFDSSLGWVSNGVVGSQAFAAFDQGYDVFLGNLRGLASREHVNKHISSQRYWKYSVNEHGTQDLPAMITKIHELKMAELEGPPDAAVVAGESPRPIDYNPDQLPYRLCVVAHSLGGAAILIYLVTHCLASKPHYLARVVLLSPAGFHEDAPLALKVLQYIIPFSAPFISPFMPGIYIPTRLFRGLFNKLSRDFQNYPALGGLVQAILSYVIGGDSSNWVGAIGVSHYNMNDMPGVAFRVAVHLAQMMRAKRFIMYDFGSKEMNVQAYGTPYPLDIGANYGAINIPVDVVAGRKDRLIPPTMVRKHYDTMKGAGCEASYAIFEFAHLDFTFANREELMAYVMSRLSLIAPYKSRSSIKPLEEVHSLKLNGPSSRMSFKERKPDYVVHSNGPRNHQNGSAEYKYEIMEELPESECVLSAAPQKIKTT